MKYAGKLFQPDIGPAISQRIAGRHGGFIGAESEVDQGATFFFVLEDK